MTPLAPSPSAGARNDHQPPATKRTAHDKAREHARTSAAVSDCPYRDKRWRSFWLREFGASK